MTRYYFHSPEEHQIPTKTITMEGGKININRAFRKANAGFSDVMSKANPMALAVKDPTLNKGMRDLGKLTQNQILPAVVSTGIPVASTALGALATMYGGPVAGEMVSKMSQGLMEEYIPQKYQSDNPYVGMLGDALSSGMSGEIDPTTAMNLSGQFTNQLSSDIAGKPSYTKPQYNPDYPYADYMGQIMKGYTQRPVEPDPNSVSDAMYKVGNLGEGADSISMVSPPYQQKEGSMNGIFGSGIKKKRGRPKKIMEEEVEVIIKKRLPHKKFSHAKNASLEQLLEASAEKEEKMSKKAMKDMIERQNRMLREMGY